MFVKLNLLSAAFCSLGHAHRSSFSICQVLGNCRAFEDPIALHKLNVLIYILSRSLCCQSEAEIVSEFIAWNTTLGSRRNLMTFRSYMFLAFSENSGLASNISQFSYDFLVTVHEAK